MLPQTKYGDRGPLVIALHWLGGSSRTWQEVGERLAREGYCLAAIDLPGFGQAVDVSGFDVEAMAEAVAVTIHEIRGESGVPWVLLGHSMGGKVAALIARAAEDGAVGLGGLAGMCLLSPSPAGPEPMDEGERSKMLDQLGETTKDVVEDRKRAEKFVLDNIGKLPLVADVLQRSIDDVLRMDRGAFAAWLTSGSKEDWGERIAVLSLPTLIMAGTEEESLGPKAQVAHVIPHFRNASLEPLLGGGHLAPLERPREVAERILEFLHEIGLTSERANAALGAEMSSLIDSDYTSTQTRAVLASRLTQSSTTGSAVFNKDELRLVRCLAELVVPDAPSDLTTRLQDSLVERLHDGWRFDSLPDDLQAWRLGLRSLDIVSKRMFQVPYIALDVERQLGLLHRASEGALHVNFLERIGLEQDDICLTAQQMRDWFEDVRAEFVKIFVSDPRTMERIGFTGFADEKGFTQIRLNEREEFEL